MKKRKRDREIVLKVNDRRVEINQFVSRILSNTIVAMVKSLRGVKGIRKIDLRLVKKE